MGAGVPLGHLQYLPLTPLLFALLAGLFGLVLIFVQLGILRYAYVRLGVSSGTAFLLLLASLIGSYINIPITELGERGVVVGRAVSYHGMRYVMPVVVDWPGTVIAVNVGGAVVPTLLSIYLLEKNRLWSAGLIAIVCVSAICYMVATPVAGIGVEIPILVPPISAAIVALIVSWRRAAPLAYAGGSLGTLIGADILNLPNIEELGAPVASIGGAGTFDGIFLAGIIAVLIASFVGGE